MNRYSLLLVAAMTSALSIGHGAQAAGDDVMDGVARLQKEWAHIKYEITGDDQQLDAIHKLEAEAQALVASHPGSPEAMIWQGIILSTDAGIVRGISALGTVRDARDLFAKAIEINPNALDGSAYTSLGSLYYQVPPWPLAFGSNTKAEEFLKKALEINPDGIDPNFFYADFLRKAERYAEAKTYYEKALAAPDRPTRPVADAGRRDEIRKGLDEIAPKLAGK